MKTLPSLGPWTWLLLAGLFAPTHLLQAGQFENFTFTDNGTYITITGYPRSATGSVEIPATINAIPVTGIGDHAFYECRLLTSVSIPSSVTSIGSSAFNNCQGLTSVTISLGVTTISSFAFCACFGLTSVTIPSSVTSISSSAFYACFGLSAFFVDPANSKYSSTDGVLFDKPQTILIQCPACKGGAYVIPSTVTSIGWLAFYGCNDLTSVTIPSSVTSIGTSTFSSCSGLITFLVDPANSNYSSTAGVLFNKSRTILVEYPPGKGGAYSIPSGVTSIGSSAFDGCSGLTSVTIPSSITSIGSSAFSGCSGLTAFLVDPANSKYSSAEGVLFDKPQTVLVRYPSGKGEAYSIPSGVTSIGSSAFAGCSGLTSVTIPSSITSIGSSAFSGCNGLTSVTLPSSLTSISDSAFWGCSGLTSVTIPSSVTSIGNNAFLFCDGLTSMYFLGDAPTLGSSVFSDPLSIYCFDEASGFTSPSWGGRPVVRMGPSSPVTRWVIEQDLPHDTDLSSDSNGDGVCLLMAYALHLEPSENLSGRLPAANLLGNELRMQYYAGSGGVTYSVETSDNLVDWSTTDVVISALDGNGVRTASVAMDRSRRFLRLVVVK